MTSFDELNRISLSAAFDVHDANLTYHRHSTQPIRTSKLEIRSTAVQYFRNLQIGVPLLLVAFLFAEDPARQYASAHENPYNSNTPEFSLSEAPTLKLRIPSAAVPAPESRRPQVAHAVMTRTIPTYNGLAPEDLAKVEIWYDSSIRDNMLALAVTNTGEIASTCATPKSTPPTRLTCSPASAH